MRYNPPPGWPPPPPGWRPPRGWRPDPAWPPPPPGWPLWVPERPRHWHQQTALIIALLILFFPVGLVLVWLRADWSTGRRALITAPFVLLLVVGIFGDPAPAPVAGGQQAAGSSSATPASPSVRSEKPSTAAVSPRPKKARPPASHSAGPTKRPSATPRPKKPRASAVPICGAPANPYRLNFCGRGGLVYDPPGGVCGYFHCIDNFDNGRGYMVQCSDGQVSMSGGRRGACSYHDGVGRPVYRG